MPHNKNESSTNEPFISNQRNAQRPSTGYMTISVLQDDDDTAPRDDNFTTLAIDETRLFYYVHGAFKHNWNHYRVNLADYSVRVFWDSMDEVTLHNDDAIRFLRITRSRYTRAAEEENRKRRLDKESRKSFNPR